MLKTGSKCSELERESYIEYTCSQWLQHAFIYASAEIGLGLWCSTLFSIIFQLYGAGKFYWWRKHEYTEKTNDLPQVTDKFNHTMLYRVFLGLSEIRTHNCSGDRN